jgi:uncharacterized protein YjbJ (UPF0337 family)
MSAIIDKVKGKLKKIEGKVTGDRVRSAQGTVEEAKGDLELKAKRVAGKVKAKGQRVRARANAKARRAMR